VAFRLISSSVKISVLDSRDSKKMADPAWNVINESATGFHIFRIEVMYIFKYKKLAMPD
jgi:hypothetical protein